ncbi:hypothetical protein [Rhodohalobacter halophilus]|uniref:hypothetical protein n=1 Tax=Rhodohalobacter halophilus TaxID=1812810 RepID=UPI00083FBAC7|nr:hypothetical protein [Rhodohalobacter halophilus]
MAELSQSHTGDLNELPLNGQTIKEKSNSTAGRPSMESYLGGEKPSFVDESLVQHYRERCGRLEGELHDSDRKIRLQIDEIMQLKRELSKDRTETLLSHQKEISDLKESYRLEVERLKENHRRDTREFERQIIDLERQAFKMELEHRSGDRTTGNRILDMLEDVAPTLFENLSGILGGALTAQGQPALSASTELSPQQTEQLRQAFEQDMNGDAGVADEEISPNNQAKTPKSGEGDESPHRSPFDEEAIGLNDFFASKANGHHEPNMEGL